MPATSLVDLTLQERPPLAQDQEKPPTERYFTGLGGSLLDCTVSVGEGILDRETEAL